MANVDEIRRYTPPVYHQGKESYIDFYAFDPATGKMRRKKIKLNKIKNANHRRKYCNNLMNRLSEQLSQGWNPWIEKSSGSAYLPFSEIIDRYRTYIDKLLNEGVYRPETHKSLSSQLKNLVEYNQRKRIPITYIYQFDKDFCVEFLDEIYINRDNTAYTRDNYLSFLRLFSHYCVEKNYLKTLPTDGISVLGRRFKHKTRALISQVHLNMLHDYLTEINKHYLLACYILYYCFIRPSEMVKLRLANISLSNQTIFVQDTISKNRKNGTITLPQKVIMLMLDLHTFDYPSHYFLFSEGFRPGNKQVSEKIFRDWWLRHIRKKLGFPDSYKFYSLKDTGITNMLRQEDVLSVRDQARHSSILMTDIYTPHDIQEANELIKNYQGEF